jgi:hypothetical protein
MGAKPTSYVKTLGRQESTRGGHSHILFFLRDAKSVGIDDAD